MQYNTYIDFQRCTYYYVKLRRTWSYENIKRIKTRIIIYSRHVFYCISSYTFTLMSERENTKENRT